MERIQGLMIEDMERIQKLKRRYGENTRERSYGLAQ